MTQTTTTIELNEFAQDSNDRFETQITIITLFYLISSLVDIAYV
jgi:hypothetical protein